ncbi:nitronate monooxygenase [Rhodococcus sp. Q1]|uniref:NAD(P)H-dependent flavin oxidoreductase n=1 Tax=Rhodococcus sp. Q1 TaxID=2508718 RepID=UPI001F5CD1BD|nr:nitronate monooxygenase [Rhodococcus sp. Q1]
MTVTSRSDRTAPLTGLRLPIVAAPMFLVSSPDLVIAAAASGIVGAFPTPNCRTTAELDEWMGTISEGISSSVSPTAPWAVNLVTHRTNARLADDLRLVAEYRPPVVITALGSPEPVMDTVKGYGGLVLADMASVRLARKAAGFGVDGMACISAGAGGHTGHLSPFAFVSSVRMFFDGIVVIGGGIADGWGVAGAVAAGADLVYMGTRFLTTAESMAPPEYKRMVIERGPDDLVVSAGITGTPASWLRPSLIANGLDPDALTAPATRDYDATKSVQGRWKDVWAAGQGLGVIDGMGTVSEVVDELAAEYDAARARFTDLPAMRTRSGR